MTGNFKRIALCITGFISIAFGLLLFFILCAYMAGGAGLQAFGFFFPVVPITIAVGVVHFIGFSAAACLCFVIGLGLIARGVSPENGKTV